MIYFCCLYNGEKELLEIGLNEMVLCKDWVQFILVEANKTHTGFDKPLYFEQQKDEFEQYKNIMYFVVDDMPTGTPRELEAYQRNSIMKALNFHAPKDDDTIIIADIDEIPRAKQINKFVISGIDFAALIMDKYNYYINLLEGYQIWNRAKIMTWEYLRNKTPEDVRNSGYDFSINDAGFHFSWIGDAVRKLESFSHTELNTPENIEKVKRAENIWDKTEFKKVEVDLSFPEYLYKNKQLFSNLILE